MEWNSCNGIAGFCRVVSFAIIEVSIYFPDLGWWNLCVKNKEQKV